MKLNNGTLISIPELESAGFICEYIYLEEIVGGNLPWGSMKLTYNPEIENSLKMITEGYEFNIKISTEKYGTIFDNIHCVVNSRILKNNYLTFKFFCVPSVDFLNSKSNRVFKSSDEAINNLWYNKRLKTNIDIRTKSDLVQDVEWFQATDFDADLLRKVCSSYKMNSIYAFGLNGLLIKDIIGKDSLGVDESGDGVREMIGGNVDVGQETPSYHLNYDPELYMENKSPYSEDDPDNQAKESEIQQPDPSLYFDVLMFNKRYRLIRTDYVNVRKNMSYNQRIYNSRMYESLSVINRMSVDEPYRLGDVIKYKIPTDELSYPFKKYFISKINYTFNLGPDVPDQIKIVYVLRGLDQQNKTLQSTDPTNETTETNK